MVAITKETQGEVVEGLHNSHTSSLMKNKHNFIYPHHSQLRLCSYQKSKVNNHLSIHELNFRMIWYGHDSRAQLTKYIIIYDTLRDEKWEYLP